MQAEESRLSHQSLGSESSSHLLTENQEDRHWLSHELNRRPYTLYKCWLFLNFLLVLAAECLVVADVPSSEQGYVLVRNVILIISLIPLFYGCAQMFWALIKKKSRLAKQSLSKLKYGLILITVGYLLILLEGKGLRDSFGYPKGLLELLTFPITLISYFFGRIAIIPLFKKNHPLRRQEGSLFSQNLNPEEIDMIEQNEAIESEVSKFDQKLKSCPYLAFKCWLKFVVVIGILSSVMFFANMFWIFHQGYGVLPDFILFSPLFLAVILTVYSCFEIETAIRKKSLEISRKALIVLKVNLILVAIAYGCFLYTKMGVVTGHLFFVFAYWLIPVVTFIGALKVNKTLEQRDQLARFSNFHDDSYL